VYVVLGKVVLNQLGIDVEAYYASESDYSALTVTKYYHQRTVEHVGDIATIVDAEVSYILGLLGCSLSLVFLPTVVYTHV
jgi:hypothetical protein